MPFAHHVGEGIQHFWIWVVTWQACATQALITVNEIKALVMCNPG